MPVEARSSSPLSSGQELFEGARCLSAGLFGEGKGPLLCHRGLGARDFGQVRLEGISGTQAWGQVAPGNRPEKSKLLLPRVFDSLRNSPQAKKDDESGRLDGVVRSAGRVSLHFDPPRPQKVHDISAPRRGVDSDVRASLRSERLSACVLHGDADYGQSLAGSGCTTRQHTAGEASTSNPLVPYTRGSQCTVQVRDPEGERGFSFQRSTHPALHGRLPLCLQDQRGSLQGKGKDRRSSIFLGPCQEPCEGLLGTIPTARASRAVGRLAQGALLFNPPALVEDPFPYPRLHMSEIRKREVGVREGTRLVHRIGPGGVLGSSPSPPFPAGAPLLPSHEAKLGLPRPALGLGF